MSAEKPEEANLSIDKANLDINCCKQPGTVRYWGRILAEKKRELTERKNTLKLTSAEVKNAIRANPSEFGVEKVTVDSVEDAMTVNDRFQDCQQALVQAEYEHDLIRAEVEGLRERGERIGDMVKLHGQMYWSKPAVTPEGKAAVLEKQREQRDADAGRKASAQPRKK